MATCAYGYGARREPARQPARLVAARARSTRSTRAPSPTPTATASATCAASRPPRPPRRTLAGRGDLAVAVLPARRWPTSATTSPTTATSTRVFGTLADFDELVAQAHARGIRVIIDWVPEPHLRPAPVVRRVARRAATSPKRDWYVWRDGAAGRRAAEQLGVGVRGRRAGVDASTSATGQWYLHSFLPEQPDLNWDNPEVEAAMHDVLRFWLTAASTGSASTSIHKLAKDPQLRDASPARRATTRTGPTIHERLRGIRRVVDEYDGPDARRRGLPARPARASCTYVNSGDQLHLAHNFVFVAACRGARTALPRVDRRVRGAVADARRGRRGSSPTTTTRASPPASTTTARAARACGAACSTRCAARRSSSRARSWGCRTPRSRPTASSTSTAATPSGRRSRGSPRRGRPGRRLHHRRAVAAARRRRGGRSTSAPGRRPATRRSTSCAALAALRAAATRCCRPARSARSTRARRAGLAAGRRRGARAGRGELRDGAGPPGADRRGPARPWRPRRLDGPRAPRGGHRGGSRGARARGRGAMLVRLA